MEDQLEKEIREEFDGATPQTKKKNKIGNLFKSQEIKELTASGDEEVFEIVDYTLASPWEKYVICLVYSFSFHTKLPQC
jgi:hypothetical protein